MPRLPENTEISSEYPMTNEILLGKVDQLFDGALHFEGVQLCDGGLQNAVIGLR